jgi:hypothetical protein
MRNIKYLLVAGGLVLGRVADAAVIIPPAIVTVRVYTTAAVAPPVRSRALAAAARALADADVDFAWKLCDLPAGADRSACERPIGQAELALRFIDSGAVGHASRRALGDALVDARTGSGTLATIYVDRVQWLAAESGADIATLLGRAVAHEITHLLLGSNRHARGGLMRAVWTCDDLRPTVRADWSLTPKQRAQVYAAAIRRVDRR